MKRYYRQRYYGKSLPAKRDVKAQLQFFALVKEAGENEMNKFRKKPVVIEAFQMTKERRWDNSDWPEWLNKAWNLHPSERGCLYCMPENNQELFISTLEGDHKVSWDDWIIQGVAGELYPCKPDIFQATYEAV